MPTEAEAYDAIMALQQDYPQGMSWTNDNTWYDDKGNSRGKGCVAFAALCQYTAFGDVPGHYVDSLDDVKVGDSIRIGNYHTVVVLEKKTNSVIVTEGNFDSIINWGREIPFSEIESAGYKIYSYYPN